MAESINGAECRVWLKKAQAACRQALKKSKSFRPGLPEAQRLQGTYMWLKGKLTTAETWWQRSLELADEMGQSYDLGMIYLEMGRRLDDRNHLERAESIFAEIGAEWGLARTREALESLMEKNL